MDEVLFLLQNYLLVTACCLALVAQRRSYKIGFIESAGAFAPFTESGTIVVNGVVASNYVSLQRRI
jgi:hypothetical protein